MNKTENEKLICDKCNGECGHRKNCIYIESPDDFMEDVFDDDDDELVPVDCPNCQRTYDDADADFLICHHCGFNANTGKVDRRKISGRNMLGLDADANDVWL